MFNNNRDCFSGMSMMIKEYIGDSELLRNPKTAFLCSRQVPAAAVLKCYDWAIEKREAGKCVISGFHSRLEKDVLYYLLKGSQPIIVTLARGLKKRLEPEFKKSIDQGRMLIITPFDKDIKRVTAQTAYVRNQLMFQLADDIVIGYVNPNGTLQKIIKETVNKKAIWLLQQVPNVTQNLQ
jgi:hypothetical protein